MKLLILLFPIFLSAQTIEDRIDSIVKNALDERLVTIDLLVHKIDSVVRAVYAGEQPIEVNVPGTTSIGFVWVDVNGNVLGRVGGSISLTSHVSIHTFGIDGPVTFNLSGPISTTRDEGSEPFALFGDIGSRSIVKEFLAGDYELTATYPGGILKANFEVR